MNKRIDDTIVAIATPSGIGAIAVIRISGKKALEAASGIFAGLKGERSLLRKKIQEDLRGKDKRIVGSIVDGERIIDQVILSIFSKPKSYTGEDVVEISCHCNKYIIREIMRLLLKTARLAEPGEFTQRAFLNHKIDLTQAEAVGDLLGAVTEVSHQAAVKQLEGCLSKQIAELLEELTTYRVELELEIDFLEQDLPDIDIEKLIRNLSGFRKKLQKLINTGREGRIIREGLVVCIIGAPNVGKSSIFNRLLDSNRAIVTDIPGTTRDYLEESLSVDGYLVRLIDTAGLRRTEELVEAIGVETSLELLKKADKIIYVSEPNIAAETRETDCRSGDDLNEAERHFKPADNEKGQVINVLNKSDLLNEQSIEEYVKQGYHAVSAKTGMGLEELKDLLVSDLRLEKKDIDAGILTNIRQIDAVEKSLAALEHAIKSLEDNIGFEFTAFDLKVAGEALEEIVGKVTDDEILNRIFRGFCIGK